MSIKVFEFACQNSTLALNTKYLLTTLSILSNDEGRVSDFSYEKISEICDIGPRTFATTLNELKRLEIIKIYSGFVQIIIPDKNLRVIQ